MPDLYQAPPESHRHTKFIATRPPEVGSLLDSNSTQTDLADLLFFGDAALPRNEGHMYQRGGDAIHRSAFSGFCTYFLERKVVIPPNIDRIAMLGGLHMDYDQLTDKLADFLLGKCYADSL